MPNKISEDIYCSFCGKPQELVGRLIKGHGAYICDQCIDLCMTILDEEEFGTDADFDGDKSDNSIEVTRLLKPVERKAIRDEYVIGQDEAKKALSVAVYSHY